MIVKDNFDPKGILPKDKDLMDGKLIQFFVLLANFILAVSSVFENVAFFGDLLIRIHDIVTQVSAAIVQLICRHAYVNGFCLTQSFDENESP